MFLIYNYGHHNLLTKKKKARTDKITEAKRCQRSDTSHSPNTNEEKRRKKKRRKKKFMQAQRNEQQQQQHNVNSKTKKSKWWKKNEEPQKKKRKLETCHGAADSFIHSRTRTCAQVTNRCMT